MGEPGVSVIVERIDNLKEHFTEKFEDMEKKLDKQCDACQNAPKFRERLCSQWFHILSLWSAWAVMGGAVIYVAQKSGVLK